MKMRIIAILSVMLCIASTARAQVIQETVMFTDIDHAAGIGDVDNSMETYTSVAAAPYRLFNLNWDGLVSPVVSTTWGNELRVHVTHDNSGREAFFLLAPGDSQTYDPNTPFSGSSSSLGGIEVSAGDTFSFEFYDSFDDGRGVDATWSALDFEFEDIDISPQPAVAPGFIRIDAQGSNQFPTTPGSDGERFWGITYGAGAGPEISSIDIALGADPRGGYFDPFLEDGEFVAPVLTGVAGVTDTYSEPDEDFFERYGTLHLDVDEDDFSPGDTIRFGVEINGLGALGFQMRENVPAPQITINFADDTSVTGSLSEFGLDGDTDLLMSFVDLDVSAATGNGEGTVPEPSSMALIAIVLAGLTAMVRQRGKNSMKTLLLIPSIALLCSGGAFAADVQTFNYTNIFNEEAQGGLFNTTKFETVDSSFTIGDINWTGMAESLDANQSFAGDMHVRLKHTPAGGDPRYIDLMLGHGAAWHSEREFSGSSPHFRGWEVNAGDALELEFFEGFDDVFEAGDSIWNTFSLSLTDDNNVAPAETGVTPDGHVRVRAIGQDSFPVTARNADGSAAADERGDGATYWQITYGPDASGLLPRITGVKFDLGDPSVMSFDRSALEGEPSVFFTDGSDESPDGLSLQFSNPDPDFGAAFGAMEFLFDPDDDTPQIFEPGGFVAIGWDIDGAPFEAADLADLANPIEVTITFEDGTTSTGTMDNRGYQGLFDVAPDGEDPLLTGKQYAYDFIPVIQESHVGADFDHSGFVDGDDFLIWQAGFGGPGDHEAGDANGDGIVDGDDFLLWQAQFGGPPSGSASGAAKTFEAHRELTPIGFKIVPEPSSIALVMFGLIAALGRRRR